MGFLGACCGVDELFRGYPVKFLLGGGWCIVISFRIEPWENYKFGCSD